MYAAAVAGTRYTFPDLRDLLAKASPLRSGDALAGIAARDATERVAAQTTLAEVPLSRFLTEAVVPYESDEVTRLILDTHDRAAFAPVAHLTVGAFRDWLLSDATTTEVLARLAPGLTPEITAATAKICRIQDLIAIAAKCRVTTRFRNTLGLDGRLSARLQPNHPTDDPKGILAAMIDGLLLGAGDAVIGINPATDSPDRCAMLLRLIDDLRLRLEIPTQSCVLTHVTTTLGLIEAGAPVDLVFQSIAGTEDANRHFGINLSILREARAAALALKRGTVGENVMYFETGQGSALSANAHHGCDQQTLEARAYGVARAFAPLLVNSVVGFIGPEYLFDGKQISRAGLEDHFCGKLLGLPMGCDICYTNHAEADQDDMDVLLTLLTAAGVTFVMGVPGADDIMLNYQSTSFHDVLAVRELLDRRPAPEFEAWLHTMGLMTDRGLVRPDHIPARFAPLLAAPEVMKSDVDQKALDPWQRLRAHTQARIGLRRSGSGLATAEMLAFQLAHARARDAVHVDLDTDQLVAEMAARSWTTLRLHSAAPDRRAYLLRPDLGRRLDPSSQADIAAPATGCDLAIVVADGLSAIAVQRHAVPLLDLVIPRLQHLSWHIGPVAVVEQGRVAIGDEIGALLSARMVVVLIGERPGLSAPDSLGAYATWAPAIGRSDAERNCISNIRPEGLDIADAAAKLVHIVIEARRRSLTGIMLKDESDAAILIKDDGAS